LYQSVVSIILLKIKLYGEKPYKKEIEMKNSMCVWLVMFFFLFVGTSISSETSGMANFGNYPADYPLAYATMAGFSKSPTVRTLFGPNAYFITSLDGIPVVVTLESTTGTQGRFTAQVLLTKLYISINSYIL
jgi:hypothetical protein